VIIEKKERKKNLPRGVKAGNLLCLSPPKSEVGKLKSPSSKIELTLFIDELVDLLHDFNKIKINREYFSTMHNIK
jgi:hypothetical protein